MFKINMKKVNIFLVTILIITLAFIVLCNNRASFYFNENKLDSQIIRIIKEKSNPNSVNSNIQIEGRKYYDSRIALYFSYENGTQKQYAIGLFKKTLLPPYIHIICLAYNDSNIIQCREPITFNMKENINILLFYNKDKKVEKIKLKFYGEPTSKTNEYINISNTEIYFDSIEMKGKGSVIFDHFYDNKKQ